jgi:ATP-dependent DNA helicase DinG
MAMAEAVAQAIDEHRHLIVQAGTGTGKSLAYLVPALTAGARVVVSTATKALQDQLAQRDLPHLRRWLDQPFEWAVLKGRSNYICLQRVAEILAGGDQQLVLGEGEAEPPVAELGPLGREVRRLADWARQARTGDRAERSFEPTPLAWRQVSVTSHECPGARRCPAGEQCFAEAARERAATADVVVVNTHLYATALGAGPEADIVPPHDVVVFDEAHELEDIASRALGFEIGGGRLLALARGARPVIEDIALAEAVAEAANLLAAALRPHRDRALPRPIDRDTHEALRQVRERADRLLAALRQAGRKTDDPTSAEMRARLARAQKAAGHLIDDLDVVVDLPESEVAWVEGPEYRPLLKVAPIDVGASLASALWKQDEPPTAVLASATIPPWLGERLGMIPGSFDELYVGSPFAFEEQALLYCPLHLPDPRDPTYEKTMHDELQALIEAAAGRTLALFTSWRAMHSAVAAMRERCRWPILSQSDLPKPRLVERFSSDEHSCLFATMGFWQGVDVPGSALSVVVIDRIPFPRPDEPLLQARRERLGRDAFRLIDVPRAATLLAQGVGRLIRSRSDRGVVAVLDPRLGKASYRWDLVRALPPMRRTRSRKVVEEFLAPLRS